MSSPRFEVVRTDAAQPFHARFRAANGHIVWTTEQYSRKVGAERAITALTGWGIDPLQSGAKVTFLGGRNIYVDYLDLRTPRAGTAAGGKGE